MPFSVQGFDEGGLGVARGRLGEVLVAPSSFTFSFMPSSRGGRSLPAFSSSSLLSSYRAVKPSKATLKPEALNRYLPAWMVAGWC